MTDHNNNSIFDDGIAVEAEIHSSWLPFFSLSNSDLFTLAQSIIFKLEQSHYHLLQALQYSTFSQEALQKYPHSRDWKYYNFITNCNIDSMIYALNSSTDIINKVLVIIYSELTGSKPKYFKNLDGHNFLNSIRDVDPATAEIIQSFISLSEREYVREYCNENKHQRAFFSAGAYYYFNTENAELTTGYNLKKKFKSDSENVELEKYAPRLDTIHRVKICQLGKSLLRYKGIDSQVIDENYLKITEMHSNKYFR